MNYFDSNTNDVLSLDDVNVQKELDKLVYQKYLRDEANSRTYTRKRKKKTKKNGSDLK